MIKEFSGVWPLLLGILLIMLGNGMHFTLIGLRGGIEGFSAAELAFVTSAYFLGFLSGARYTPVMIRRVGHVRVFAALGSFMSAGLIAFPLLAEPWAWTVLRILIGFCMSGIYVSAESWLNNASSNESRGKVLAAYMIAQTLGIIGAQGLLSLGDAATPVLFIIASIMVSISFGPILLSATPVPAAETARAMSLRRLYGEAPLGTVGIFLLGAVYAVLTGMAAVFGSLIGLSAGQVALLVAVLFGGALVLQYPIGWLSDRIDRRKVILAVSVIGAGFCALGAAVTADFQLLLIAAFFVGGVTTPLYALLLAYTNDWLATEDMPAASGGLVFTFGLGAILGPLATGWAMDGIGPVGFWLVVGVTFAAIALFALYRMTQRASTPANETETYVAVLPSTSTVAVEAAANWTTELAEANPQEEGSPGADAA